MRATGQSRTVWLTRHGLRQDSEQINWHATAERPHDPPLSAAGRLQAKETGRFLRDKGIERIYCSPFLRTAETAGIIARHCRVPVYIEHGLCEVLRADWFSGRPEYVPPEELHRRYEHIAADYRSRVSPEFPETEESGQLDARCLKTVDALMADSWICSLWVGHGASVGGVARGLTGTAEGVCFEKCGLTAWTGMSGKWRILYSGTNHLSVTEETMRLIKAGCRTRI